MFPNGSPMLGLSGMSQSPDMGVSPFQANNNYQTQQQDPTQALLAQLSAQGATAGGGTGGAAQLSSALTADPLTTAASQVQPMSVPANPLTTTMPAASTTTPAASTTTAAAPASSSATSLASILSALGITPSGTSASPPAASTTPAASSGSNILGGLVSALGSIF